MSFDGLDIEQMFAEAAGSAEDTGEKNPSKYGKKPPKEEIIKKVEQTEVKKVEKPETKRVEQPEPKPQIKEEVKPQIKVERPPLVPSAKISAQGISVDSIVKILEMQKVLDGYNPTEREFVMGYFQVEQDSAATVIFEAITADPRDLDALEKIVTARNSTAAERAFYLMDLENDTIEAVYEQVELITGELGESGTVNDKNKINVCRSLEKAISSMQKDVFTYINKLQEFTNKALS